METLTDTIKLAHPDWTDQEVGLYLEGRLKEEGVELIQSKNAELSKDKVAQFFEDGDLNDFAEMVFDVPVLITPPEVLEKTTFDRIQEAYPDKTADELDEMLRNGEISYDDYTVPKQPLEELKDTIRSYEQLKSAQSMVKFIQMAQEGFRIEYGRYFGTGELVFKVNTPELQGLEFNTVEWKAPDGEIGYRINFSFTHPQIGTLIKTVGVGSQTTPQDWTLINPDIT